MVAPSEAVGYRGGSFGSVLGLSVNREWSHCARAWKQAGTCFWKIPTGQEKGVQDELSLVGGAGLLAWPDSAVFWASRAQLGISQLHVIGDQPRPSGLNLEGKSWLLEVRSSRGGAAPGAAGPRNGSFSVLISLSARLPLAGAGWL